MKQYVKIDKELLSQIYEISKGLTHEVEDWGWGDKYPEIVKEKVFNETLLDEMRKALKHDI